MPFGRKERMGNRRPKSSSCHSQGFISEERDSQEVSSIEWEYVKMSDQEEDLIYRMYRLVGDRWELIAGRIPGRKAEEIERFWVMRHGEIGLQNGRKRQSDLGPFRFTP